MAWIWLALAWWAGAAHAWAAAAPVYYKDVAPVVRKHCEVCHRRGEIGPMPLTSYAEARPWAKAIREAVLLKKMPPWLADPKYGTWANDPSLTEGEIATLARWADAGAPAGSPKDGPPAKVWPEGWTIPHPDAVLETPAAFPVPASGVVEYQYIVLPAGFTEDKWVSMAEVRPSARAVVHHAVVYIRPPGSPWLREAKPGVPYSVPEDDPGHAKLWTTSDLLLVYAPGNPPDESPPGMAKKIPAGSDLVLQLHYTPNGKPALDRERIGLVFARQPVVRRVLSLQMGNGRFVIPPGDPHFRVSAHGTLPEAAELLSLFPHMHLRGSSFDFRYIHPDGTVETLLSVPRYEFHWQISYRLASPRPLPAGARLEWVAYFDNSANNPRNPDPTAAVHYGEQSGEEMMIGFFDVAVPLNMDKNEFFERRRERAR